MKYVYIKNDKIVWISSEKIKLAWAKEIGTNIEWKIVFQDWKIVAETETKEHKAKELAKEDVAEMETSKYSEEVIQEIIDLKKQKILLEEKVAVINSIIIEIEKKINKIIK